MTFLQVIVKEGELQGLAPLGGDESTIRSQQVGFRNQYLPGQGTRTHQQSKPQPKPFNVLTRIKISGGDKESETSTL